MKILLMLALALPCFCLYVNTEGDQLHQDDYISSLSWVWSQMPVGKPN